jgi:hypothetical protein
VSEQQKVMGLETLWDPMSEQQTLMGSGTLWDPSWEQPADADGVGNSVGFGVEAARRR